MRIAVTGAAGYIGGWLCPELQSRGHEVCAQDIRPPGGMSDWDSWHSFSLSDGPARAAWLERCKPDAVIHLAALYGRVWGERDLSATAASNAGLAAEVARDCRARGARLMLMSSSEVYGESANRGPVDEGSPLEPLNMYGLSKKWAEEAARLYCPDGLMIARLNMPYGPPPVAPADGEVPATSGKAGPLGYNVLHTMCWQASHGMPVTVHEGTERCLTWAGDTVRGLATVLESGQAGTWNVNRNDDHVPVGELARLVISAAGSASRIISCPPPPGVTMRKSLRSDALAALGWRPAVSLEEGVRRSLEHYRRYDENGTWRG